jgi:hypothetical protein
MIQEPKITKFRKFMGMKTISPRRQSRPQEIARMQDFAPFTPELLGAFSDPQTPCRKVACAAGNPLHEFQSQYKF